MHQNMDLFSCCRKWQIAAAADAGAEAVRRKSDWYILPSWHQEKKKERSKLIKRKRSNKKEGRGVRNSAIWKISNILKPYYEWKICLGSSLFLLNQPKIHQICLFYPNNHLLTQRVYKLVVNPDSQSSSRHCRAAASDHVLFIPSVVTIADSPHCWHNVLCTING